MIGRLGFIGETCFKGIRFQGGGSGKGDLHPSWAGGSLNLQHEEMCVNQFADRLPVSAGDAERSGWKEGYIVHELELYGRCSSTSATVDDANCDFFEEEEVIVEVIGDTPRGFQRDGFLRGETQGCRIQKI